HPLPVDPVTAAGQPAGASASGAGTEHSGAAATAERSGIRPEVRPIEVDDVSVRFGAVRALSDVSFRVEPGTVHAVIGPNGAGKSTMFNVLSGVYKATSGQVR